MGDTSVERKSVCGIFSVVCWPRNSTSAGSFPSNNIKNNGNGEAPKTPTISKRRRGGSDESAMSPNKQADRIIARPGPNHLKVPPTHQQIRHPNQIKTTNSVQKPMMKTNNPQGYYDQSKKVLYGSTGISGELESMMSEYHKSKVVGTLLRASSGNVMLVGSLGNLKQGPTAHVCGGTRNSKITASYVQTPKNVSNVQTSKNVSNVHLPEIVKKKGEEVRKNPAALCRTLSTRMDPEELKILGNEDYKNGNFEEALALYDAAIYLDPNKASYRSNKSATLTALGRLLEAVFECREALRIEPHYQRAHNRLATLYVRLGDPEKAMYHYKLAGDDIDPDVLTKAKKLQIHLSKCTEAKKHRDFNTLVKETELAILAGADSAPQIFSFRAETMLKLRRHGEAAEELAKGPKFDVDSCTTFLGAIGNACILIIRAQVDTAAGRFDEAVEAAQQAAQLDGTNKEVNTVLHRTQAMAMARANGNDFFLAQKYGEACMAYGEGLNHDPCNSVLLCNRATCKYKLGQYEKAIEDCNTALRVRPSYRKARLRRADCYAKLEKWEACIQDYKLLVRETPEDMEVCQALKDAQIQLTNK